MSREAGGDREGGWGGREEAGRGKRRGGWVGGGRRRRAAPSATQHDTHAPIGAAESRARARGVSSRRERIGDLASGVWCV